MLRIALLLLGSFLMAGLAHADPGQPNFMPALWGDGEVWGTKGTTTLAAPRANNVQSFDALYVVTNSNNPQGQLPVAAAAPGNSAYNGGRWFTHTVEWTEAGFMHHGFVPILKSYRTSSITNP